MRLLLICFCLIILSISNASANPLPASAASNINSSTPEEMVGVWGLYGCSDSFSILGLSKYFYFSAQPGNSFIQPILDHVQAEDFMYLTIASNIILPIKLVDQDNLVQIFDITAMESADYSVSKWDNLEPVTSMSYKRCSDEYPEWLNKDSVSAFRELDKIYEKCSGSKKLKNPGGCLDVLYQSIDHDHSNTVDLADLSVFYQKLSTLHTLTRGKPFPHDFLKLMSEESPEFVDIMISTLDTNKDNLISSVEFEENWELLRIEKRFEKTKKSLKYLLALIDTRKINPEVASLLPESSPVDSSGCEIDPDYFTNLIYDTDFDIPLYID